MKGGEFINSFPFNMALRTNYVEANNYSLFDKGLLSKEEHEKTFTINDPTC